MLDVLALTDELNPWVTLVEETAPDDIIERTLEHLRGGATTRTMLAAAAIAVSRRTEVPFDHHGGPLHCVTGIRATAGAVSRLSGDWAYLPVLHSVHLANTQVRAESMGPHIMLELGDCGLSGDAAVAAFLEALHGQMPLLAERRLRAVLRDKGPGGTLELILAAALPRFALDDHFLLYAVFAAQTLDFIGWAHAEFVLRPVVRWLASPPLSVQRGSDDAGFLGDLAVYHRFGEIEALVDDYGLVSLNPRISSLPAQANAVGELGVRIGALDDFDLIPAMMAEAIAKGLSLEGGLEALSVGAATLHLRSDYGNPLDVHMHNGLSIRRYLLAMPGLSLRTRLLGLLSWAFGPEIRLSAAKLSESSTFETAGLPNDPAVLLNEIERAIANRPPVGEEVHMGRGRAAMRADSGVRDVMALAQRYVDGGHDSTAFTSRITAIVCRDSFTEMHAFEHVDDTAREYAAVRGANRGRHLVSAAKIAYCGYGIDQTVFEAARTKLHLEA